MSARMEVADVFRRHVEAYRRLHDGHLGRVERRVMSAIELCRTAELGGHVEGCRSCGTIRVAYNSCRNRHCPKCQGRPAANGSPHARPNSCRLPTSTLCSRCRPRSPRSPSRTRRWSMPSCSGRRPRRCARSPPIPAPRRRDRPHRGAAQLGPGRCTYHPHIHCIVPGGGISLDGKNWVACRPGFFLPVRVLSRLFRRLFLEELRAAFEAGKLSFFGDLAAPGRA